MNENKSRMLLVIVICLLLMIVLGLGIIAYRNRNKDNNKFKVKFNQLYVSDYELTKYDDYFFEKLDDKIYGIVNNSGKEIYLNENGIIYDKIYKTKDGNFLIYNTKDNGLNVYLFDGKTIKKRYSLKDLEYVKPLILKGNEDYIIGFVQVGKDNFKLYNIENGEFIIINDLNLVSDSFVNDIYYVNTESLVVNDLKNNFGVIDLQGNKLINCDYNNIVSTVNNTYIALNDKNKYGIVDSKGTNLVGFKYDMIIPFKNYYIFVKGNKMALFDENFKNLTGFVFKYYPNDYNLRNKSYLSFYSLGNYNMIINDYSDVNSKYNDMYVIKNNELFLDLKQEYVGINNKVFIYNEGKVSIFDSEFNKLKEFSINKKMDKVINITSVYNDIIEIEYLNDKKQKKVIYYDYNSNKTMKEKRDYLLSNDKYLLFLTKEDASEIVEIVSYKDEIFDTLSAGKITVADEFVIADKSLYKIVISN